MGTSEFVTLTGKLPQSLWLDFREKATSEGLAWNLDVLITLIRRRLQLLAAKPTLPGAKPKTVTAIAGGRPRLNPESKSQ